VPSAPAWGGDQCQPQPVPDNGIKFFSAQGTKLPDAWEEEVEALIDAEPAWVDSRNLGKARRLHDAAGRYIEFCKSTFANDLSCVV
jgi:phosphoglucosamine mutase